MTYLVIYLWVVGACGFAAAAASDDNVSKVGLAQNVYLTFAIVAWPIWMPVCAILVTLAEIAEKSRQ